MFGVTCAFQKTHFFISPFCTGACHFLARRFSTLVPPPPTRKNSFSLQGIIDYSLYVCLRVIGSCVGRRRFNERTNVPSEPSDGRVPRVETGSKDRHFRALILTSFLTLMRNLMRYGEWRHFPLPGRRRFYILLSRAANL